MPHGPAMLNLGTTGLVVSRLGLGLAALGRPAYITAGRAADVGSDRSVEAMERRCHAVLDAAYDAGIRYLDTARSYGYGERFLASWLRRRRLAPGAVVVGSKWGYRYVGEWRLDAPIHEVKDLSAATLERQLGETRSLLGEYVRLFQIHSATLESGVLDDAAVVNRLAQLRADSWVIGLTVTGPHQSDVIRRALTVRVDGRELFRVVQATWNLMETSAETALAEAAASGCGVIVKEALANGRLTNRYAGDETAVVRQEAARRHCDVAVLALGAALAQPWAHVVLSGAVTVEQLHSNLSALQAHERVRDLPALAVPPQEYWTRRAALPWL